MSTKFNNLFQAKLEAEKDGMILRFPWMTVIAIGAIVLAGVWLTNRDLRMTINHLTVTVARLETAVQGMQQQPVPSWFEDRVSELSRRVERLERRHFDRKSKED